MSEGTGTAPGTAAEGSGVDLGPDIVGFEMGDSGYVEPVWEGDEDGDAAATEQPAAPAYSQPEPAQSADFEQRYNSLRPEFDRATSDRNMAYRALEGAHTRVLALEAELQQLRGGGATKPQQTAPNAIPDDVDLLEVFSDPQRGREYISQQIKAGVDAALGGHKDVLERQAMREELIDLAGKYPDFWEMDPYINAFYDVPANANVPFEQAYHVVKRIHSQVASRTAPAQPPTETPARTAAEQPATKVPLTGLQERASRLRTEQGVGGAAVAAPAREHAGSTKEAFLQALAQSGGR